MCKRETKFKIGAHSERIGTQMIEVWVGDRFVGALYPGAREGELRFISKHLKSYALDQSSDPPVLEIRMQVDDA